MSRSEILEEIDPEWSERYRGDVDLAWNFGDPRGNGDD